MLQHFTPGLALGVPRKVGGIVGEVGYAAAVTEQVADGDVCGIFYFREESGKGGVQTQLTCFNGLHDKNGGKGFADGTNSVTRIFVCLLPGSKVGKAHRAGVSDLTLLRKGHTAQEALAGIQNSKIAVQFFFVQGLRAEGREAGQQQEDESGFSFWVMHGNGFSLPPNYGKLSLE